jgi:quercetin dioxygenase-like cupin family protein
LLQPGGGETIFDGPERTIRILADREELALTLFRFQAGQEGPEPHVRRRHTDAFYVLEGELELGLGCPTPPSAARGTERRSPSVRAVPS